MAVVCKRNAELIPGYRLTSRLGKGAFGEVWKCQAPGDLPKALKWVGHRVEGSGGSDIIELERKALDRIKSIRHPYLLALDRVEVLGGELIVIMELADQSLRELLQKFQAKGEAGIPRHDLLRYLHEAAEVLDLMNFEHGLQHLDVKPDNLFLVGKHVKVADFGLVSTHADASKSLASTIPFSAAYTPPERFQGSVSPASDQYSLAIVYQELLTGSRPFDGKNANKLLFQHVNAPPELSPLPNDDRDPVAKALSKNPADRFASCTEFIEALSGKGETSDPAGDGTPHTTITNLGNPRVGQFERRRAPTAALDQVFCRGELPEPCIPEFALGGDAMEAPAARLATENVDSTRLQAVLNFLNQVRGGVETRTHGWIRYLLHPNDRVEHTCFVSNLNGAAASHLERFRQQWNARAIWREPPSRFVFQLTPASALGEKGSGTSPELVIHIHFFQPRRDHPFTEVRVTIKATGGDAGQRSRHLLESAPRLLESLHEFLQPYPDMRLEARVSTDRPLEVYALQADSSVGPAMLGRALDVTTNGMRLWLPSRPHSRRLRIHLPTTNPQETLAILAEIRRIGAGADGGHEVGVRFQGDGPLLLEQGGMAGNSS